MPNPRYTATLLLVHRPAKRSVNRFRQILEHCAMAGTDVNRRGHAGLQLDAGAFGVRVRVRMRLGTRDDDHESSAADALAMEAQETAILARPGLANPD